MLEESRNHTVTSPMSDPKQPISATIDFLLDRTSSGNLEPLYKELGPLNPVPFASNR